MNVRLNGDVLKEVESFKYLGSVISRGGGVSKDVRQRTSEGAVAYGAMRSIWRERKVGMRVKCALYESIVVPKGTYAAESWGLRVEERKKLNVMEMNCLRNMCGVTRRDMVRSEVVRRRVGVVKKMEERVDERVLSWYGHAERMNSERITQIVYESKVDGSRGKGVPPKGWMSGVKDAVEKRGMTVEKPNPEVELLLLSAGLKSG